MLSQSIRSDMTEAMKARDSLRVETLRGCLAAFTNELVAKDKKPTEEITDQEAISVLKRLVKQRREAAEQYKTGGRAELAEKEERESKIIESYLPKMASREDIEKVAREKKAELNATDKAKAGILTGAVMKAFSGNADGAMVKEIVDSLF